MINIYIGILVPIILSVVALVKFRKEVVWFEHLWYYGYYAIITFIFYLIINFGLSLTTEYYGSYITEVRDYEYWNEYIHKTCTETYACGTDSKGNTKYCTRTYDCSYVEDHWQYYQAYTSTGESFIVNDEEYNYILKKLGSERMFVDMHRSYYTIDGDMYKTTFTKGKDEYVPVTTWHTYENRIKSSDLTIFNLKEVSKEDIKKYKLQNYPRLNSEIFYPSLIGYNLPMSNKEIMEINGVYGKDLQIRVFFWIFDNPDPRVGLLQEYYLVRGNKNEVNVCIGIDKNRNIAWVNPFTWSLTLKTPQIRNDILAIGRLTDKRLSDYIKTKFKNQLISEFKRREFSQFDYIEIEAPLWAIIIYWILLLLGSGFIFVASIENDIID